MEVIRYHESWRASWDSFIMKSKNGMFQFLRSFLDYHGNKFSDHSLIFMEKDRVVACLAGHQVDDCYHSHKGLSYGGLVTNIENISQLQLLIGAMEGYLTAQGFKNYNLRVLPGFMHPINESLHYLLLENGASMTNYRLTMLVNLHEEITYSSTINRKIKKYANSHSTVGLTKDLPAFYQHLADGLNNKYQVSPLHTLEELQLLQTLFPDHLECWEVIIDGEFAAGCILFMDRNWVKLQYLFSAESNASTLLLHQLYSIKGRFQYFDLGSSNSLDQHKLNVGNHQFKHFVGGRPKLLYNLTKDL